MPMPLRRKNEIVDHIALTLALSGPDELTCLGIARVCARVVAFAEAEAIYNASAEDIWQDFVADVVGGSACLPLYLRCLA